MTGVDYTKHALSVVLSLELQRGIALGFPKPTISKLIWYLILIFIMIRLYFKFHWNWTTGIQVMAQKATIWGEMDEGQNDGQAENSTLSLKSYTYIK